MQLSDRLQAVLNIVPRCGVFADIGCDHGKLALAVMKSGLADFALLTDISDKSLDKARKLFKQNGITAAGFYCGDGMQMLTVRPDVAVIAGMGGQEIKNILDNAPFLCETYILQPMRNSDMLRDYLAGKGYDILYDRCMFETKRFYDIIKVRYTGIPYTLCEFERACGKTNLEDRHGDFMDYLNYRINSAENILKGSIAGKRRQQIAEELALFKKALLG